MEPTLLLIIVGVLALLIILGTLIAVIVILRRPDDAFAQPAMASASAGAIDLDGSPPPSMVETMPVTDSNDFDAYLEDQKANLSAFELGDLSNSFKGISQDNQRTGVVLHQGDSETGLIAFTSQALNPQSGIITGETAYGKMEIIITSGKAGVKWQGNPLGILDFANQRILGPEGRLLGSLERPAIGSESGAYPITFLGQKVADLTTDINAVGTLRWFDNESGNISPAFQDLAEDLEDNQTLLLMAALLLEVGFMDLI